MKLHSDNEILKLCRRPGTEAFEEGFRLLYVKYKDLVYRVSLRVTGNATDALDAAQETFIQVYKKLGSFKFNSKFSSWLYRISVNCSIDICRKRKKKESFFVDIGSCSQIFNENAFIETVTRERCKDPNVNFQGMLSVLSPKLRVVVVLRYLEGLSYSEIAETLQIAIGTVKSRLSRAHLAIGHFLKKKV
jgi:RNA polymerase sigma-70 factor (ECF subfamily)